MNKKKFFYYIFLTAIAYSCLDPLMAAEHKRCNLESLKGTYRILFQGTFANDRQPVSFASIDSTNSYDGHGHFISQAKVSRNGLVKAFQVKGTYSMKADCTGTTKMKVSGLPAFVFWSKADMNHGMSGGEIKAFLLVSSTPGMVGTGEGKKY